MKWILVALSAVIASALVLRKHIDEDASSQERMEEEMNETGGMLDAENWAELDRDEGGEDDSAERVKEENISIENENQDQDDGGEECADDAECDDGEHCGNDGKCHGGHGHTMMAFLQRHGNATDLVDNHDEHEDHCHENADCHEGEHCGEDAYGVRVCHQCHEDADCHEGGHCGEDETGVLVCHHDEHEEYHCDKNADCYEGEHCEEGLCHCKKGEHCEAEYGHEESEPHM